MIRQSPLRQPLSCLCICLVWGTGVAVHASIEEKTAKIPEPASAPGLAAEPARPTPQESSAAAANPNSGSPPANAPVDELTGMLNLGRSLTDRGDYPSAEIAYREVLKSRRAPLPVTKDALLGLARVHHKQGADTKAAAIYEKFLHEYPGDDRVPDVLLSLGRTLRTMGAYKSAIARFYSVINSTLKMPGDGFEHYQMLAKTAQFEIAETHYATGDFTEASKFFLRLRHLELAPVDRARAHFKAAYAMHLGGDAEGAVNTLRTFLDQCPEDENVPEARYLLAVGLRKLKHSQEALAVTLDLLSTEKSRMSANPKRWIYWQRRTGNQLANDFFEDGDTGIALAIYSGLLPLSTEPAWRLPITYQTALCYERLGEPQLAGQTYRRILETAGATPAPELADLVRMAAWRLEHLGWRDQMQHQLTTFFETTTGREPSPAPPPQKTASFP